MNKGLLQLIKTVLSGIKIGKRVSDKIAIFRILTRHVLVNRGLAKFSGRLHEPIHCIFKDFPFTLYLRDNGTDAIIFYDIFINECYKTEGLSTTKVIYDLGTNIGIASLYFASVFPEAKIYGFEPMPENYKIAKMNYSSINDSQVYETAVGDEDKEAFLLIDEYRSGSHQVCDESRNEYAFRIPIKISRLDTLIKKYKIPPPDFLKIDTEGAEYSILKGLGEFRKYVKFVCIETHSLDLHNSCKEWIKENHLKILKEKPFTSEHLGYLCALKND
jgi:FkbM family methyltransferase